MIKIAVLLGTQEFKFNRLINYLETTTQNIEFKIQANFDFKLNVKYQLIDSMQYEQAINEADYCIVHGGAGTIFKCLNLSKKVIIFPRLAKYQEHIDDHQLELSNKVIENGWAILASNNLNQDLEKFKKQKIKKYENNFRKTAIKIT